MNKTASRQKKEGHAAAPEDADGEVGEPAAPSPAIASDNNSLPADQASRQPGKPSEALGDVAWLMTQSPAHKHLFLADIEWLVLPPLMSGQFRLFTKNGRPYAFACWAWLDEEAEQRRLAGQPRLRPADWRAGDRAWLIDVIAPFGGVDGVLAQLKETNFKDKRLMAMRSNPDGKSAAAVEVIAGAKEATAA